MKPFDREAVQKTFDSYPHSMRRRLLALRSLIFETAASTDGVGPLEETLKWGEPAYLTSESRSGSTVRIAWKSSKPSQYAMYFNCQTNLVESFRSLFPSELNFEDNRASVFDEGDVVPKDAVSFCIAAALMYHRNKNAARSK